MVLDDLRSPRAGELMRRRGYVDAGARHGGAGLAARRSTCSCWTSACLTGTAWSSAGNCAGAVTCDHRRPPPVREPTRVAAFAPARTDYVVQSVRAGRTGGLIEAVNAPAALPAYPRPISVVALTSTWPPPSHLNGPRSRSPARSSTCWSPHPLRRRGWSPGSGCWPRWWHPHLGGNCTPSEVHLARCSSSSADASLSRP